MKTLKIIDEIDKSCKTGCVCDNCGKPVKNKFWLILYYINMEPIMSEYIEENIKFPVYCLKCYISTPLGFIAHLVIKAIKEIKL